MFVFIVPSLKPLEMKNSISDDYIRRCFSSVFAFADTLKSRREHLHARISNFRVWKF